jgi:hypothetical protein
MVQIYFFKFSIREGFYLSIEQNFLVLVLILFIQCVLSSA